MSKKELTEAQEDSLAFIAIENDLGRSPFAGKKHASFSALEKKGLVISKLAPQSFTWSERKGMTSTTMRRAYTLTKAGRDKVNDIPYYKLQCVAMKIDNRYQP